MNYKRTPWDEANEKALDTESAHIVANDELGIFPQVDRQMDDQQEIGYANVSWIARNSTDPDAKRAALQALEAFGKAEILEGINEEHVELGHGAVKRARHHNQGVIALTDDNRKSAAQGQRNARAGAEA